MIRARAVLAVLALAITVRKNLAAAVAGNGTLVRKTFDERP